jgi:3-deoxy-manno-octulosonate cytidylyltransferase (CMP-KDO synthetase)
VEQHGKNPLKNVIAIIPARYESVRLEGKLLLHIAGKPLILHTLEQAGKARTIERVIVATDSDLIRQVVEDGGGEVVITSAEHQSGSDRIAEVAETLPAGSIVVNVQADEPMIAPETIDLAVEALLADTSADVSTTCERITDYRDVLNPDIVKVVTDEKGFALYFSRSPVPYPRDAARIAGSLEEALREDAGLSGTFRKHTGLYVYRREYLLRFTGMAQTALETTEMLEQLRALENGGRIKVVETVHGSIGVDTAEDLVKVRELLETAAV